MVPKGKPVPGAAAAGVGVARRCKAGVTPRVGAAVVVGVPSRAITAGVSAVGGGVSGVSSSASMVGEVVPIAVGVGSVGEETAPAVAVAVG